MLYVNNFASVWGEDWCLPHTWYLDVEMQIFVVALPAVLLPMWFLGRRGRQRDGDAAQQEVDPPHHQVRFAPQIPSVLIIISVLPV